MNRGLLNGLGINGGAQTPSWFKLATATATATAIVVSAIGVRTAFGSSIKNGSATASVSAYETFSAHATATCGATSSLIPTLRFAGRASAIGTATGLAAVLRLVSGEATADATSSSFAIPSSKLGEATTSSASTVISCLAHLIRPGAANVTASALAGTATGLATRYCTSFANGAGAGRADQTVKRYGEAFKRHDGYAVDSTGTSTSFVDNSYTAIIAGIGSLRISSATGVAHAYIVFSAESISNTIIDATAFANRTAKAVASASGGSTASVTAARIKNGAAIASVTTTHGNISALMKYQGRSINVAVGSFSASGVRTAYGTALNNGNVTATAQPANFYRGAAATAVTASGTSHAIVTYAASAIGASAVTAQATAGLITQGLVHGTGTATGSAEGFSNADVHAPDERYMTAEADDRVMFILFEDRLLLAA